MPSKAEAAKIADRYVELALAGRGSDAVRHVLDAVAEHGFAVAEVCDQVLRPAAVRIGQLWHAGDISVADEHHVSELTRRTLALLETLRHERSGARGPVVLACPEEELHDIGLRMLAEVLRADGWDVRTLGAKTPARDIADYAASAGARVVGLSCSSPLSVPSLWKALDELRTRLPDTPVVLGGTCVERYPTLVGASGADAGCVRVADAVEVFGDLVDE